MRLERGRPLSLLIGDGGCPGYMAIEARMRNQETEPGQSLKAIGTPEVGKCIKPLQRARQLKALRESDHLIVLRDGRADHTGEGGDNHAYSSKATCPGQSRARSVQANLLGGNIHGMLCILCAREHG